MARSKPVTFTALTVSNAQLRQLEKAGYAPVVRWVYCRGRTLNGKALTTTEALARVAAVKPAKGAIK